MQEKQPQPPPAKATGFSPSSDLVVEIHFGEGGDDSKNFVHQLLSAYCQFALRKGFESEILTSDDGHAVVKFSGDGVWEAFQHEPGKHVVQRFPDNDRSGRPHTSLVSVAVLPLPPEVFPIVEKEIVITTQRGHGKGGQNVNKVSSAVRATHPPTGMSVFINGRDQYRNKQIAITILSAKVNLAKETEAESKYGIERREQLGDGGRGSKIRTYNFIKHFVKDHRTGKKIGQPDKIMKGWLELLI